MQDPNADPTPERPEDGPQTPGADPGAGAGDGAQPGSQHVEIADEPGAEGAATPYQNMWVPLIVIPAAIVIALVGVFALFGNLAGSEKSLSENLSLALHGGKNERKQALFSLSLQATENQRARSEGLELPHPMEESFPRELAEAALELDADDYEARQVFAILQTGFDDPAGVQTLLELIELGDEQDEDGRIRLSTMQNLGLLAKLGDEPARAASPVAVRWLTEEDDVGLRIVAAGTLPVFGGDGAREALMGGLEDEDLGVRATSALSLADLDPPGDEARGLLKDMAGEQLWEDARAEGGGRFRRGEDVRRYRLLALEALAEYGDAERAFLQSVADAGDVTVAGKARELLAR